MNTKKLKDGISVFDFSSLYKNEAEQRGRYLDALNEYEMLFGEGDGVSVFSVPGRCELLGNHTDHNGGKVLAAAIDRDVIAFAARTDDGKITVKSKGYDILEVALNEINDPENFEKFTSSALVAGVANGFLNKGYGVGGFSAYITSDVPKGSGISSSAAYEVMIGNIINHLYNGGRIDNVEIAKISQYAENVYFGKPSGLMDQTACAVGGFVYIDFLDKDNPKIEPISFPLSESGYELCIVNTGGSHADLNDDYAAIPLEMKSVAAIFGKAVLSDSSESDILSRVREIRNACGDRALLRAIHFVRENARVEQAAQALKSGDVDKFFREVIASGKSSFEYLQNVYTVKSVREQGLSVALALADGNAAVIAHRVHGGGFAGTVEIFVRSDMIDGFLSLVESVFGVSSVMRLNVRDAGAIRVI